MLSGFPLPFEVAGGVDYHPTLSGFTRSAEVAVMLLGASVSFAAIAASGPLLIGLIVAVIVDMITLSLIISRA